MLVTAIMRRPLLGLALVLPLGSLISADLANAGRLGGGGRGGGGALSRVSSGLGDATPSRPASPSRDQERGHDRDEGRHHADDVRYECNDYPRDKRCTYASGLVTSELLLDGRARPVVAAPGPRLDVYAGAQKLHDSDGSASLHVAVSEHRFRMAGALTHYFENLPGGGRLTMTMPQLTAGVRIDHLGATRVFVEGGVVYAKTAGDPMENTSLTGAIIGIDVEHQLSPRFSVIGTGHTLHFKHDVEATALRLGLRVGHVQASLRVLDFNVGPALWGPEVGVRF